MWYLPGGTRLGGVDFVYPVQSLVVSPDRNGWVTVCLVVSPDQNGWVTIFVSSVLLTYGSVGEGGLVLGNAGYIGVGLCAHTPG